MIIEYPVPSLALNYHGKKYQIIYDFFLSVFVYMHEKQILMQEWIFMKCPIQVMLAMITISILNMHELVETWLPEA